MNFNKFYILFAIFISNLTIISSKNSDIVKNNGFYINLSNDEKMHLIIGSLDSGLYKIFSNFQNDKNTDALSMSISMGIEKYKAMLYEINPSIHTNSMYLYFFEYSAYLCKYGRTAEFLATLNIKERTALFTLCYKCWLDCYNKQLNTNLSYTLDDINEYFAKL
jgi:hypothetical protein